MNTEEEYPNIKEVLNNSSKVANAYCAAKYAIWQVGYVLFLLIGGVATILVGIALLILAVLEKILKLVGEGVDIASDKLSVSDAGSQVSEAIESGHEKSKETPVVRRIWGECPVSIKQEPKWFETIADTIERKLDDLFH